MKATAKKEQFISLRIEGKSFSEIAKALNTPKSNLIEWNKEKTIRTAINEGLAIQLNDTVRNLEMNKQASFISLLKIYKKVIQELDKRDLSDVPTDKLVQLSIMLHQKVNEQNNIVEIGENNEMDFDLYSSGRFGLELLG